MVPSPPSRVDGKLWFVGSEGIQVDRPARLSFNTVQPPVLVERFDRRSRNSIAAPARRRAAPTVRLPPRVRDLQIDYTALSFVAPEKVRFKYRLDGRTATGERSSTSATCSIRTCIQARTGSCHRGQQQRCVE
jgi:hypothetical protein